MGIKFGIPKEMFCNQIDSFHDKVIKEATERLQQERGELITKRLKELGLEMDLEEEERRRFKRFCLERKENEETLYYNDGSEEGLRVITFVDLPPKLRQDEKNHSFHFDVEWSYY